MANDQETRALAMLRDLAEPEDDGPMDTLKRIVRSVLKLSELAHEAAIETGDHRKDGE